MLNATVGTNGLTERTFFMRTFISESQFAGRVKPFIGYVNTDGSTSFSIANAYILRTYSTWTEMSDAPWTSIHLSESYFAGRVKLLRESVHIVTGLFAHGQFAQSGLPKVRFR